MDGNQAARATLTNLLTMEPKAFIAIRHGMTLKQLEEYFRHTAILRPGYFAEARAYREAQIEAEIDRYITFEMFSKLYKKHGNGASELALRKVFFAHLDEIDTENTGYEFLGYIPAKEAPPGWGTQEQIACYRSKIPRRIFQQSS